ncbi:hypothetical protein QUF90_24440 [Desulfococcaceae bacterium HSG9]|nr:hypothetical protein [Desulfococcaceae bacterium HSG9]
MMIEIEGLGRLELSGAKATPLKKSQLTGFEDIPRQVPRISAIKKGEFIRASHIFIPDRKTPYSMKRILNLLIRSLSKKTLDKAAMKKNILQCENTIIELNIKYYEELNRLAGDEDLQKLSRIQLRKIREYSDLISSTNVS